jgi:molybdopterin molybdotransferase
MGHTDVSRRRVRARLTEAMSSPPERRQYRRGVFTPSDREVTGIVGPRGGPGSHLLAAFTQANCLIVLPEDVTSAEVGEEVDVLLL